ncbi:hypothetical protein Droror1_Dr00014547 [Drosera rotundifolia]
MFSGGLIITYQFTVGLLRVSAYPVLDAAAVILLKGLLDAYAYLPKGFSFRARFLSLDRRSASLQSSRVIHLNKLKVVYFGVQPPSILFLYEAMSYRFLLFYFRLKWLQ